MRIFVSITLFFFVVGCTKGKSPDGVMSEAATSVPTPTPVATPPPVVAGGFDKSIGVLRMTNRHYVASTLKETFGPTVNETVKLLVLDQGIFFGGACDPYSSTVPEDCPASNTQLASIPSAGTSRLALTNRMCNKIASQDPAIQYAAIQIADGKANAWAVLPTADDVKNAMLQFYDDRPITDDVVTNLMGVVDAAKATGHPPLESWRFLLLTICLSPGWQIN